MHWECDPLPSLSRFCPSSWPACLAFPLPYLHDADDMSIMMTPNSCRWNCISLAPRTPPRLVSQPAMAALSHARRTLMT
eukprot:365370-Chlamydomonas_euryale.AAC.2